MFPTDTHDQSLTVPVFLFLQPFLFKYGAESRDNIIFKSKHNISQPLYKMVHRSDLFQHSLLFQ